MLQVLIVPEGVLPVLLLLLLLQFFHFLDIEGKAVDRLLIELLLRLIKVVQHSAPLGMPFLPDVLI